MMRKFGLIGYPLSHSFSKKFFSEKFESEQIPDVSYDLFPIENVQQLPALITGDTSLRGLNVTIPHKLGVLDFLNEMDDAAQQIGAVNCISIEQHDGEVWLKGYNTDAYGFEESLKPLIEAHHQKALVFGDGGAAKAVKYVLGQLNIPYLVVTRRESPESITYEQVTSGLLDEYTILINTTPLGMSPNTDTFPDIPYSVLSDKHLVYDLVYNPEETAFLRMAKGRGATIKNGLEMLYLQAERSWVIWNRK